MQQVSSEVGKREYQCFTFGSGCTEGFAAYKVLSGLYSELTCWWSWVCLPSRSPNHHHGSVHSCIWPPQGCLQEEYCKFYIKHWLNTLGTVLLTTKCECWNGIKVYVMCRLFIVGFLAASPEQREFMIAHYCVTDGEVYRILADLTIICFQGEYNPKDLQRIPVYSDWLFYFKTEI